MNFFREFEMPEIAVPIFSARMHSNGGEGQPEWQRDRKRETTGRKTSRRSVRKRREVTKSSSWRDSEGSSLEKTVQESVIMDSIIWTYSSGRLMGSTKLDLCHEKFPGEGKTVTSRRWIDKLLSDKVLYEARSTSCRDLIECGSLESSG